MGWRRAVLGLVGIVLVAGLIAGGYFTRTLWLPWIMPTPASSPVEEKHGHAGGEVQQVKLSPQAQSNLRLVTKPLQAETFWRTIQIPGIILDRPAQSDRNVVAPVTGVVAKVHHLPGETVWPEEPLFTLRLLSDTLQLTQSELFKNTQEIQIVQEQKRRLTEATASGAIPEARMLELDYQLRRLAVAAKAYRQELQSRGFRPEQIDAVAEGKFVSEILVTAPPYRGTEQRLVNGPAEQPAAAASQEASLAFEVQELKVDLGQQVQAGQTLGLLSNHQALYIEGRAFRQETPLLEKAAKENWPVRVELMEETTGWPPLEQSLTIRSIANTIDPTTRTLSFWLLLENQARTFAKEGRTFLLWRFRPGQKVRLHLQVEKFDNVFVLPAEAVVWEGPEAYVFRQNGDLFDRKPVRVVYQDRQSIAIANDGSIPAGLFVVQNGALQLNRVLKAQGSQPSGFHVHADGSVHANH